LSDPAFADFRRDLYGRLATGAFHGATIARMLTAFADEAGKEAGPRRDRLRWAMTFLVEFYRQAASVAVGGPPTDDVELQQAAEHAARAMPLDAENLAWVVDRCLEAAEHIDRNVHPTTLVDALCDDVAQRFFTSAPL
jgi:hypothetical protein